MSTPPWQYWLSLGLALMLSILPLPYDLAVWNPDWVALVVILWVLHYPRRVGVGAAWIGGLLLDVMQGTVLGSQAMAMTLVGYLTVKFYLRLRVFPLGQQAMVVALFLALYHFVLFWIEGVIGGPAPGLDRWYAILPGILAWVPMQAAFRILWPRLLKT